MLKDIKSIDTVLREGSIDPDRLDEYISEQREVLFTLGLDLFLEDKCNNRTPEAEGFCKEIGIGPTVMNTVSRVRNVINEKTLIDGLVLAGCETRERIEKAIGANVFPEGLVRRPGMKDQELLEKYDWIRQDWFLKNASLNWLRLAGILDPVSYEEVFQNAGYNLMDKQNNSEFAYFVSKYGAENANHMLLNGKDVLTIGGGSGRDEIFWAKSRIAQVDVKSITMVDASPSAIGEMKKRVKVLSSSARNKLNLPKEPEDMFEALKRMIAAGETFDTIYGLSVFHYFDDARFKELFELMHSCLRPGGYVAFAVKAPGTTFDGVGIPLITREENYESSIGEPGTHRIYEKYVLNLDGQYRNFRDVGALTNLVEGLGFDVIHSSLDGVEQDYEFSNQGSQKFIKFVIQKPQAVVENIDSEKK